jgi:uncharacterized membrane protein YeaQ/YmgE (transglycosylase-associated protein family)
MAKNEIILLVKEEGSGWYGVFRFFFSVIFGLIGAYLAFNYSEYLPIQDAEIAAPIGFIVGFLVAPVVLWLIKMALKVVLWLLKMALEMALEMVFKMALFIGIIVAIIYYFQDDIKPFLDYFL